MFQLTIKGSHTKIEQEKSAIIINGDIKEINIKKEDNDIYIIHVESKQQKFEWLLKPAMNALQSNHQTLIILIY